MQGKIFLIQIARNFHGAAYLIKKMKNLETKILIEKVKITEQDKKESDSTYFQQPNLDKMITDYLECSSAFERFTKYEESKFEANRAFVTFLFQGQKLNILHTYAQERSNKLKSLSKLFSKEKSQEENLVLRGHKMQIKAADEPTSINFENIGITRREKNKRNFIGLALVMLLMASFFLFMMVLTLCGQLGPPTCDNNKDYTEILDKPELRSRLEYIDCYCRKNFLMQNLKSYIFLYKKALEEFV